MSPLLPSSRERERLLALLTKRLNRYWQILPELPIGPEMEAENSANAVNWFNFDEPQSLELVAARMCDLLEWGIIHVDHPRNFGLFNPTPTFAGMMGEMIAAAYNAQLAVHNHAPPAVEAEKHVIRSFGERLGFPRDEVQGHFTTGGSEANLTAVLAALTRAFPSYAEDGLASLPRRPLLYVSRESHHAWFKIAHQLGLGRSAVRVVETDGRGQMDAAALKSMIESDRTDGAAPFMVAATAGTTNAGMVDPLHACGDVAAEQELWLHVDAAWAGALAVSDKLRPILAGIERADSVTVDAHKWLAVPMGAGMYIGRDRKPLEQSFKVSTSYMPSAEASEDPYLVTTQWSRRFIGLKMFMSFATHGWPGYAAMVERHLEMASLLRRRLGESGFEVLNDSEVGVTCFVPANGTPPSAVVDRVQAAQRCWVSTAEYERMPVIRACVTSYRTGPADVEELIQELRRAAYELSDGEDAELEPMLMAS